MTILRKTLFLLVCLLCVTLSLAQDEPPRLEWMCEPWPECQAFHDFLWQNSGEAILIHDFDSTQSYEQASLDASRYAELIYNNASLGIAVPIETVEYLRRKVWPENDEYYPTGWFGPNPYQILEAYDAAIHASDGQVAQTASGDAAGAKLALFGKVEAQLNVRTASGQDLLWDERHIDVLKVEESWPEDSLSVVLIQPRFSLREMSQNRTIELDASINPLPTDAGDAISFIAVNPLATAAVGAGIGALGGPFAPVTVPLGAAGGFLVGLAAGNVLDAGLDWILPSPEGAAEGIDRGDVARVAEAINFISSDGHYLDSLQIITVPSSYAPVDDKSYRAANRSLRYIEDSWMGCPDTVEFRHLDSESMVTGALPGLSAIEVQIQKINIKPHLPSISKQTYKAGELLSLFIVAEDPNGDILAPLSLVGSPGFLTEQEESRGFAEATYRYECSENCPDSFDVTIRASDGRAESTTTFQVVRVNQPPYLVGKGSGRASVSSIGPSKLTMDPSWEERGCMQFCDPDGDTLRFRKVAGPTHGSADLNISGSNGDYSVTIIYTVDRDEMIACHRTGRDLVDQVTIRADDRNGGVCNETMVFTFAVINTPPDCLNDIASTPSGVPVLIDVLANDSDPDEDALTVVEVSTPAGGTAVIIGNQVGYIPDVGICGIETFTYTADDGYEGQTTASVSVTVLDNVNPVAVCQNVTLTLDSNGEATLDPTSLDGGSTDNCGIASFSASQKNFNCSDLGNVPVIMTVYDHAGNEDSCWATVTVVDDILPDVMGRDLTVQLGANGQVTVTATELDNGSSDNCGIVTTWIDGTESKTFTCAHRGTNVVVFTVFDASGNSASTNVSVTVEDVLPPTAVCQNITASLDENGQVTVAASAVGGGSTDNCAIASLALDRDSFTEADIGDQSVVLTVTDTSGNAATCDAVITVQDNSPPIITCPGDKEEVANPGQCYATGVNLGTLTATDNCEVDWDTLSDNAPAQFPVGVTVVTWTVDDVNGNTGTCTQQVQVTESVDPVVNCPGDMMVQTHDPNGIVVTFTSSATDNCDSSPQISCSPASGSTFSIGNTLVTCTATDNSGNTADCTFTTVTVVFENDPPVALDDEGTMPEGGGCITIAVLANDFDPDNDELEVIGVGTPTCGTSAIINDGLAVRYCTEGCSDPPDEVTFSYTITDGHLGTASAVVTVDMPEGGIITSTPPPVGE